MKQEIISYLSTIKDEVLDITKYLYDNPEESFHEFKAYDYIVAILRKHDFKIQEHYLEIPTAFYAEYGSGHPKVCFLCEYDAVKDKGHFTGHNGGTAISIAAAFGLSKVIVKAGGTVIILGCPGEYISGAKIKMARLGTFDDIDVAFMAHPFVETVENGTSNAVVPIRIRYWNKDGINSKSKPYSLHDAYILTFNTLEQLTKGFTKGSSIDNVIIEENSESDLDSKSEFYVRATKIKYANEIEKKVRSIVSNTADLMNLNSEVILFQLPYEEVIPNSTLSRLFCHNLKENGILQINGPKDIVSGLSLGIVSNKIPCIHPYISIIEDLNTKFETKEFALATLSSFAQDRIIKTAQALAFTALDLIEKPELLSEANIELQSRKDI